MTLVERFGSSRPGADPSSAADRVDDRSVTRVDLALAFAIGLSALSGIGLMPASPAASATLTTLIVGVGLVFATVATGRASAGLIAARALILMLALWVLSIGFIAAFEGRLHPSNIVIIVPCLLPLLAGALSLRRNRDFGGSRIARRGLRSAAMIWAIVWVADALTAPANSPLPFASHERAYIALLIMCIGGRLSWLTRILVVVGFIVSGLKYPSATVLAAAGIAVITLLLQKVGRKRTRIILAAGLGGLSVWLLNSPQILSGFYLLVGRADNTSTRDTLWVQAVGILERSPFVGGAGSEPIVGVFEQADRMFLVPIHNSWLTLAIVGGGVAVILFGAVLIIAILRGLLADRVREPLTPALTAAAITFSVNPTLDRVDTAIIFWLLLLVSVFPRQADMRRS